MWSILLSYNAMTLPLGVNVFVFHQPAFSLMYCVIAYSSDVIVFSLFQVAVCL